MKKYILLALTVFAFTPSAHALKINGQLEGALLEKLAGAPADTTLARIYWDTVTGKPMSCNGTSCSEIGGAAYDQSLNTSDSPTFVGVIADTFTGNFVGRATTALALDANPTDCVAASTYAIGIDAQGNLTCAAAATSDQSLNTTDSPTFAGLSVLGASDVVLSKIRASVGHTAHLMDWENELGTPLAYVNSIGNFFANEYTALGGFNGDLNGHALSAGTYTGDNSGDVSGPMGATVVNAIKGVGIDDTNIGAGKTLVYQSGGILTYSDVAGGPKNFVTNPSAKDTALFYWATANVSVDRDTTSGNKIDGIASFKLTAATHTATFTSDAMTLDDNTTGDCEAQMQVKGDGSKWTLQLLNASEVAVNSVVLKNVTDWTPASFNYPCATGYKLRVVSNAASPANINVGAFYWGKATNLANGSPTTDDTAFTSTLSNAGNATQTFFVSQSGNKATIRGAIAIGATPPNGVIKFTLPPGLSLDAAKMGKGITNADAYQFVGIAEARDDSGGLLFNGHILRDNTSLNTFYISTAGDGSAAGSWAAAVPFIMASPDVISIKPFTVPILGWTSESAIRPDKTFDATGMFMSFAGACPSNTVIATASGGKTIGLAAGDYQGANYYGLYAHLWRSTLATTGKGTTISATAGASASADWAAGKTIKLDWADLFPRGVGTSNTLTGQYQADDLKAHGHGVNIYPSSGGSLGGGIIAYSGTASGTSYAAASSGGTETRPMNGGVNYCVNYTGTWAAPLLVGSVTSNSLGLERIERAYITGTACAVVSQSGAWITSTSHPSTGNCTLTVTGFSARPACTLSQDDAHAPYFMTYKAGSTATTLYTQTIDSGSVTHNANYSIICMGPR
jgi:hypothetical protein